MIEEFQKRIYQLHQHGNSYCVTIPKPLVTEAMIKHGVYIELIGYGKDDLIIKLMVADDEHRKHIKDSKASRSYTQKSRTADNIR